MHYRHYREPRLCDFSKIELTVPRHKLIQLLFKRNFLQADETIFLKSMLWKSEAALNKLLHVKSICEKSLLKSTNGKY